MEYLDPNPSDVILDATIGCGGHSKEIIKKISPNGRLVGIEQDREILDELILNFKFLILKDITLINGNFGDLEELLKKENIKYLNGALFDLGMNSLHLDESGRGFSFQKDEPLHMSFKTELGSNDLTAKEILNTWPPDEIYEILKNYGEERFARSISENIVKSRTHKQFKTTFDLVDVIQNSVPTFYSRGKIHPATKTFQALRITVNDELEILKKGLKQTWSLLEKDGRLVVISFHSLEDRIVKNFFREKANNDEGKVLTKKPVIADEKEKQKNPRSRSAKLRAVKKL